MCKPSMCELMGDAVRECREREVGGGPEVDAVYVQLFNNGNNSEDEVVCEVNSERADY